MPQITKLFHLDVTPQKYVDACDISELNELILLANKRLSSFGSEKELKTFLENVHAPQRCTCPTAAAMKYCKVDCDEK